MPVNRCDNCHEPAGCCLCYEREPIYTATPVPQPELSTAEVWDVAGGRELYTVKRGDDGVWSCSCPHHRFRRVKCKHIETAADARERG